MPGGAGGAGGSKWGSHWAAAAIVNGGLESVAGRVARLLIAIVAGLDGALDLRPSTHQWARALPSADLDTGHKKKPPPKRELKQSAHGEGFEVGRELAGFAD